MQITYDVLWLSEYYQSREIDFEFWKINNEINKNLYIWVLIVLLNNKNKISFIFFRALQIPVSDYTYDDCRIISKAHQLHIPRASTIVEAHKLRNKLGYVIET